MAANEDLQFRPHPLVEAVEETLRAAGVEGDVVLPERTDVPDLQLFAGFLGYEHKRDDGTTWWLLYLDSRLHKWLLVPTDDIVVYRELADDNAFDKKRDLLWVNADARLLEGSGSQTIEGLFLVGEFTRAGDYAAATARRGPGTATGLVCEATTPTCYCYPPRTR